MSIRDNSKTSRTSEKVENSQKARERGEKVNMKKIILIAALAILPANILFSADKKADESWKNRKFTAEELKKYDGKNGMPVYVAADGIVYDVTKSKYWKTGSHMKMHKSGGDLTKELKDDAPQRIHKGGKILQKMPKVGVLEKPAAAEEVNKSTGAVKTNPRLEPITYKAESALEAEKAAEKAKKIGEFFKSTGTAK